MQTRALKVQATETPGRFGVRLALVGDLDADGSRVARRALDAQIAAGKLDMTIDLDGVGILESTGLATLIWALRRARERGGDIRVVTTNPRIRRLLEVTALARVFKLRPAGAAA